MSSNVKIASGISLVAGLWLMASAFVMAVGLYSNPFIVGILVAIFALIALSDAESSVWVGWVNGLLGFWMLISPLFLAMATVGATWNSVILGLVIIGSSLWGMMSSPSMGRGHPSMS
ncbi:MAG: hypothetical protein WC848_03420 [Parcubacteria group bacterium]|jgi:hypothetical protein